MNLKNSGVILLMFMMVFIISACSSDGEKVSTSSNSPNGQTTADVPQEIVVRVNDDPDFLDPHKATASISYQMIMNLFEGLMAPETNGSLKEGLAESYEVSEDGLTYTFKIRQGVKFHNGDDLTMDDIQYSFDRLMGKNGGEKMSNNFDNVASTEAPDASTFVIKLKEPNSNFLYSLTARQSAIIPKSNDGKHNENPIGTGPFAFVKYAPGTNLELKKNDNYWQEGLPYLNKVTFTFQSDDQAAIMSLMANEVDLTSVPWHRVSEVEGGYNLTHQNNNSSLIITFNETKAPFDNVKVRQAINYAISKSDIIDSVFAGYAVPLGSNMSPAMGDFQKKGLESMYKRDIEKAKALLAEAGYPDGFKTKITVSSHNDMYSNIAQIAVANLQEIGIDVEIEVVEWGIWLDRVYFGRDYEMTTIDLTGRASAYEVLNDYISTNDSENFFLFKNDEYDKIMTDVLKETDQAKQIEYYHRAQEILAEQATAVYIADYQIVWGADKQVTGLKSYPFWFHDMSEVQFSN
ncbi:ABC transporter substrate-binding protein [Lysinibacillus sp. FSL M8-0216]|uniref:ABC transporter substrate-binding protein n=1 Tax=Lysinibacillus TaxID=400634 RepID=UPI000BBACF59|nr:MULTISPECIES: ABC transporter substrate-binding protein [Lysinibacillus]MCG7434699.1 ABC transporter substrate-binding protein [Lysinibacillus fusiformis]MED4671171.1 ABC transporter substrate-binding protein [Lysinibacillus fusiformis]NOG28175.1 DNA-binding protein [Lysinibacillus fusiformis]PCD84289.1 DNA-binding protein [Lysinibacillus fusiformis]QAS55360.1 DNA-binding protein [Lysinibacillus sphaericus]